ncbi:MAG: galactose-1-phosphate uridylyltransferase [Gemmatimonadetes bacterium]|nr:galactose-1-phosphate uridylyltransferase [Gemmatimonadota bacterium]MBI2536049.1 galactose-1-phosphate uridylyltransferase [Gemmatimonadota bacterium]
MVWEQRWHPLRREWVVVSSHRNERPWHGERVADASRSLPPYLADCYLCPGNARSSGRRNERYTGVFVFDNDHPCVGPEAPTELALPPGIYRNRPAGGCSRVVCFTPRHDLTLAQLGETEVVDLLAVLQAQYRELGARADVRHVLVFENKGEVTGVSNPHPHCQIYATNFVFKTIELEAEAQAAHVVEHGRPLFQDILAAEDADGRRLLVRRDQAVSFVPYFARYPYETFVAPRATRASLADLTASEVADFAAVLRETVIRLDNLWRMPFPYVMVWHQAPTDGSAYPGFHFHVQIHPPLRKPGLLKYLAGPEIGGGNFLNDTAPEEKAAELQGVSSVHYTQGG